VEENRTKKSIIIVVACCVVLIVSAWVIVQALRPKPSETIGQHLYFTDDDGETWFVGDNKKQPPFDHNGKEAVCVFLYTCDDGKTKNVSYLLKFDSSVSGNPKDDPEPSNTPQIPVGAPGALVKRKGDTKWVRYSDWIVNHVDFIPRSCPDSPANKPVECYPE
jgi:hypothetical protein